MIDINEFRRNQALYPREELEKYNGRYVAWSLDGKSIVAADTDPIRVDAKIRAAGLDPGEILVAFVAIPEDACWGGLAASEDLAQKRSSHTPRVPSARAFLPCLAQ